MKVSEFINDLISAALSSDEDLELELEGMEDPVVVIHNGKIVITEAYHVS